MSRHEYFHPQRPDAFERELTDLIPYLRAFARNLCGNYAEAEDLAQQTVMKALVARGQFQPGTSMKSWTFTILRNVFYTDCAKRRRQWDLSTEVAERTRQACDNPHSVIELDEVRRALMTLTPAHREMLLMVGAAGLSYEEVAAVTHVPIGTIKSRVSRARKTLAGIIDEGRVAPDRQDASQSMDSILVAAARAAAL